MRLSLAILLTLLTCLAPCAHAAKASSSAPSTTQVVFLLHGLGKTHLDMVPMARTFRRQGFQVVNWHYRSTKYTIETIADQLAEKAAPYADCQLHFVTHSMGGIVVRTYLSRHKPKNIGRFVMIAPPNQGAWLSDQLRDTRLFKMVFGPAGCQLGEQTTDFCAKAGIPTCPFGILAGGKGKQPGMVWFIPGDNDGVVSVECTRLEGAADFALLPYPHVAIHMMPRTMRNAVHFIQCGHFLETCKADKKRKDMATVQSAPCPAR